MVPKRAPSAYGTSPDRPVDGWPGDVSPPADRARRADRGSCAERGLPAGGVTRKVKGIALPMAHELADRVERGGAAGEDGTQVVVLAHQLVDQAAVFELDRRGRAAVPQEAFRRAEVPRQRLKIPMAA